MCINNFDVIYGQPYDNQRINTFNIPWCNTKPYIGNVPYSSIVMKY